MAPTRVDIGIGSAYDFFFEIARPNFVESQRKRSSHLAALNAVWPLWHMCEWYVWEHDPDQAEKRGTRNAYIDRKLLPDCPELAWLRDIAEAGKHFKLLRDGVLVKTISPRESFGPGLGCAPLGTRPLAAGSGVEFVVEVAGDTCPLEQIIHAAFVYWLGKVLPYHVRARVPPDQRDQLEEMSSWCRDRCGDETAGKPRWTLLQGANHPHYVQWMAFLEAGDRSAFRDRFQATLEVICAS